MVCARCLTENANGHRFCDACGAALDSVCEACGHSSRPGARFCAGCGRKLAAPAAAEPREAVPLMPPRLAAQVLESRFARDGERKLVTIIFADIKGSTELIHGLDPEQALLRLDPTLQIMSQSVHRFGGTVNRVHGDGIMALFGAPLAHEDHAVRACFAARAMLDAIRAAGWGSQIRVGLHSGEVVVRSVGNDMSMEYEAVGPTAHLASRIEQAAAPGTACLSAETAQLADGFIVVNRLGAAALKGIAAPVELFELLGTVGRNRWQARAASRGLTRFVGRAAELDQLVQGLRRASSGRGTVIEIVGEAGMGKSRLVHELTGHPEGAGCHFTCSAAMPYDRDTPYFFIASIIRALLGVSAGDNLAHIDERLVAGIGPLRDGQDGGLTALRALLDLPFADPAWDQCDAVQRRQRTHEAVRSLLMRAATTATLVLILEDLHWVDSESLGVLKVIVGSISAGQILVIATSRPEFESGWPRYSYSWLLRLAPLEAADADTLLRTLLGDAPDLARLRQRLIVRTGGEPLFLEEMARALVETGALLRDGEAFRLTNKFEDIKVPSSLQAVIASRIDRLPVESRTLLQIASVIGKDVAIGPLRAVADLPEAQLFAQLAVLQSFEFLHELNQTSHLDYTFKHALTHSVTYDGMLLMHRRALHERVLSAIELLYADRLEEFTERLAQHAVRAENHVKAVEYNHKAGLRANARSAYREATVFFERALEALKHLPETAVNADRGIDIRLGLRVALLASGELLQVRSYLEQAEALARSLDDRWRLMPIIISRATILVNLGALDQAVEAGLQGCSLAEHMGDAACYVSACFALGQAYWNQGDFKAAVAVLSRAINRVDGERRTQLASTTGNVAVLCRVSLSHSYSFMGEMKLASETARQAMEIARGAARPYDLSYAHTAQGLVDLTLGHLPEAVRYLEEGLHFSEAGDIRLLYPHVARYLGRAYALAGRYDEARALLLRSMDYAAQHALVALHGWCAAALGLTHLLAGDLATARSVAGTAFDLADRHGYAPLQAHAARLLGVVTGRQDAAHAPEEAEEWFRRSAATARELGMQPDIAHCHQDLADLLVRTGRHAEARSALIIAARVFHSAAMPVYALRAEQQLAALPPPTGPRSSTRMTSRLGGVEA
jgi:predicted ATPase/class 3 adenylate cyclase